VARLSSVEIDIFLTSASPDQRDIVRTLREIITRRAGGLAERVSRDKGLTGYLVYENPAGQMVFAIGLTGGRTVTLHLLPYASSRELQDQCGAAFGPFQVGKGALRFGDPAELPVEALSAAVDATPGYLGPSVPAQKAPAKKRRWR
jgi:hypothetical protein